MEIHRFIYLLLLSGCIWETIADVTEQATCQNEHVLAVQNTPDGTSIFFSALTSDPYNITIHVSGRYLPSLECGEDYKRCGIFIVEQKSLVLAFIPSVGGYLRVAHQKGQGTAVRFEEVSKPCSPSAFFSDGEQLDFRLFLACFNLTLEADNFGSLYFVEFDNITGSLQQSRTSNRQSLHLPSTVSEVVHVLNLQNCLFKDALFLKDGQDILYVSTDLDEMPRFRFDDTIANCPGANHLEYYGADEIITYCNNQDAVVLNTCTNDQEHYSLLEGVPYLCNGWDKVILRKQDKLVISSSDNINGTEIDFPINNITYGKCVGSEFWALAENGTLYSVVLTGGNHTVVELVSNICTDNATCLRPRFSKDSEAFGAYFDPGGMRVSIVNFTSSCDVQHVSIPFQPNMYAIVRAYGEHLCSCSADVTEPPTMMTLGTGSPVNLGGIVGGTIVGFVLLTLVITGILILVWLLYKKCNVDVIRRKLTQHQILVPNGVEVIPMSPVDDQGGKDVVHGKTLSHSPTNMHEDSVQANLNKRGDTEELWNDRERKANVVS